MAKFLFLIYSFNLLALQDKNLKPTIRNEYHPVSELTAARADDNEKRLESLEKLKKPVREYPEIEIFGYHDREEFSKFTVEKEWV